MGRCGDMGLDEALQSTFSLMQGAFSILLVNSGWLHSFFLAKEQTRFCIIEQVYFARPESTIFGINVYRSRKRMGEALARECKPDADFPTVIERAVAALYRAKQSGRNRVEMDDTRIT